MTFSLGEAVDTSNIFIKKRSQLTQRYDPNYYRFMEKFWERLRVCTVPIERLRNSLALVQYGISERATEEPIGVPMLRMINLQDNTWDVSDLKYIQMTDEEKAPYLLQPNDLLFNRTNSKELVGKCNVFNLLGEYVFASYLIRVQLHNEILLPSYVTAFLASSLGRLQIDAVSRQIAGMTNINAEEIRDLYIPMLDMKAQQNVVSCWQDAIQKRDQTLENASQILASIDDVILEELGISQNLELPNTLESRIFLRKFSEVNGNRIDPASHQEKRRHLETAIRTSKYPIQSLRHVVSSEKKLVNEIEEGKTYIGLENIDGRSGEFISTSEKESISTAVQFELGQILFPKLRPYLNKTHLAVFSGICSTEFHVFTPHSLNSEYLASFLRSRAIVGITSLLMTGNTLPRLQLSDIEKLPIPLPPREVQERIVAKIQDMKTQARKLYADASTQLETAKLEIENLILGHEVSQ